MQSGAQLLAIESAKALPNRKTGLLESKDEVMKKICSFAAGPERVLGVGNIGIVANGSLRA